MNTIITEQIEKSEETPETQDMVEALAITLDEGIVPQDDQTADESESETPQGEGDSPAEEPILPAGVTPEPQDPEHMDLRKVQEHGKWVRAYINVSDDEGHLLGDKKLESEIKALQDKIQKTNLKKVKDPDVWVARLKDVTTRYCEKINFAENIAIGIVTKYRIRMGSLFIHLKYLVKKKLGQKWLPWFKANYDPKQLRTVQDYMAIAAIPNAIRYAVFGKERLLEIIRQLGEASGADPIGDFLSSNGIDFNPEKELDSVELRIKTDIAIGLRKLAEEKLEEVSADKVEALVRSGMELENKHIADLKATKEIRGDLNLRMDQIISTGGKVEKRLTAERKADSFKHTMDRFIDLSADALRDDAYLRKIDLDLCRQMKAKIEEIERKLATGTESTN